MPNPELNTISPDEESNNGFVQVMQRIRSKIKDKAPSGLEITKEVETVRTKRYKKRNTGNLK